MIEGAAMTRALARNDTVEAFLDAAERLLITVGYPNITTRLLAEEARANHGLVHYYFGSMEQLFMSVLERYTDRLIERQREMYAADRPFIEKWHTAMAFLDQDRENGYQKIWFELQALAWNRPEARERMATVHGRWRTVLTEACAQALEEYGIDRERYPVQAIVALVISFNEGIILERLGGIVEGHAEVLAMIDRVLMTLEAARGTRKGDDNASTLP